METPSASRVRPENSAARQEAALREWADTFGTTPERLKKAVDAVGIAPRRIRRYLIQHGGARPR